MFASKRLRQAALVKSLNPEVKAVEVETKADGPPIPPAAYDLLAKLTEVLDGLSNLDGMPSDFMQAADSLESDAVDLMADYDEYQDAE